MDCNEYTPTSWRVPVAPLPFLLLSLVHFNLLPLSSVSYKFDFIFHVFSGTVCTFDNVLLTAIFQIRIILQITCCLVAMGPNLLLGSLGSSLGCLLTLKSSKGLSYTLYNPFMIELVWDGKSPIQLIVPKFSLQIIIQSFISFCLYRYLLTKKLRPRIMTLLTTTVAFITLCHLLWVAIVCVEWYNILKERALPTVLCKHKSNYNINLGNEDWLVFNILMNKPRRLIY